MIRKELPLVVVSAALLLVGVLSTATLAQGSDCSWVTNWWSGKSYRTCYNELPPPKSTPNLADELPPPGGALSLCSWVVNWWTGQQYQECYNAPQPPSEPDEQDGLGTTSHSGSQPSACSEVVRWDGTVEQECYNESMSPPVPDNVDAPHPDGTAPSACSEVVRWDGTVEQECYN